MEVQKIQFGIGRWVALASEHVDRMQKRSSHQIGIVEFSEVATGDEAALSGVLPEDVGHVVGVLIDRVVGDSVAELGERERGR